VTSLQSTITKPLVQQKSPQVEEEIIIVEEEETEDDESKKEAVDQDLYDDDIVFVFRQNCVRVRVVLESCSKVTGRRHKPLFPLNRLGFGAVSILTLENVIRVQPVLQLAFMLPPSWTRNIWCCSYPAICHVLIRGIAILDHDNEIRTQ
jgi:hypothetical protein